MIAHSILNDLFIRACILFLRYLAPLGALFCIIVVLLRPAGHRISLVLEIWALVESVFLLLVYFPRDLLLQHAARHPEANSRDKRAELFQHCIETIEDPERYLSLWHRGALPAEIKRENVKGEECSLPRAAYGFRRS